MFKDLLYSKHCKDSEERIREEIYSQEIKSLKERKITQMGKAIPWGRLDMVYKDT